MSTKPEMPDLPEDENVVFDLIGSINPEDLSSLVFTMSDYQRFHDEKPTVVLGYIGGQLGMVVWNLEPGQENDFHVHPSTEHVHVFIDGECEYTLGDQAPVLVRAGDAVMVPAGVPHGIHNLSDKRASYVAFTSPGPYEKVRVDRAAG